MDTTRPLQPLNAWDRACRNLIVARLQGQRAGTLVLQDHDGAHASGPEAGDLGAEVRIHDPQLYRMLAQGGSIGAAESYLRGHWDCDDLVAGMRILARQYEVLDAVDGVWARAVRPLRRAFNSLRRNSRIGSRRNIAAHYDLSNDFFALWLDPTMTYSSGVFPSCEASMEDASRAKFERIAHRLSLTEKDHVVEVGCGWGGFAIFAAENYGCRVTATTISEQQYEWVARKIEQRHLSDRITLCKKDYRDLQGTFDKLVSIEMIEAVGERYLEGYFRKCADLLNDDGMMLIQAITMPDYRYEEYRRTIDFIQRYIFPGGFLPSFAKIGDCLRKKMIPLQWFHVQDQTIDYAETLSRWRVEFWDRLEAIQSLGFDERFIRMWHYYLCYCEAGFRERQIGVQQLTFVKPGFRDRIGDAS